MTTLRAALTGVASYLPEGRLTNDLLEEQFGSDPQAERAAEKTGIHARRVAAEDEFTSDLAIRAAKQLFYLDERHREGIDLLILVTASPDHTAPCTASFVQTELGLPTSVGAFDVLMGCSGYAYALGVASGMVESGRAEKVLVLTADRFTPFTEHATRAVRTLFGDGATASIVERAEHGRAPSGGGIIGATRFGTDGTGARSLWVPTSGVKGFVGHERRDVPSPTFEMNGSEVFDFTLKRVPGHVTETLAGCGLGIDDVDLFVFHQANGFMLEHLRRRLRIPAERFVVHISDVGNTVSSSIPIAMASVLAEGRVNPGARVMLTAFGTGYSWGSVLLEYPPSAG